MSTITALPRGAAAWDIDPVHSNLGFSVRHLVISRVHGRFARWSGTLALDDQRPEQSRVDVRIESASIDTHEPQRDAHLRSADFLDSDAHPEIAFRSTRIESAGDHRYQVAGDLTIAGVTRPIRLDVETLGRTRDPWGGERAGFSARTSLDRRDFGLVWNQALESGGVLVGEKVEIEVEIEAVRRPQAAAAA
ncbi:MAG TPA: YceI family protein [Candidatus Eisenbacteria bacterium]